MPATCATLATATVARIIGSNKSVELSEPWGRLTHSDMSRIDGERIIDHANASFTINLSVSLEMVPVIRPVCSLVTVERGFMTRYLAAVDVQDSQIA